MKQIIECVPNFSEGIDSTKIEKIVDNFRDKEGVVLLDFSSDADHNRTVVTVVGEYLPLKEAVIAAMGTASELIDLRSHKGQHPRMGATDVVPFIPIQNTDMEECIRLSKEVAEAVNQKFEIPSFLYEKSASSPDRENLAKIRKGEFENMSAKIKDGLTPDYGHDIHKSAGITAIGARMPLVAYNVNIDTSNLDHANQIARKVRHGGGGLRFCKAMGVELAERGITQVSMNMTDFSKTALYRAYELIGIEAKRYNASIVGSEVIGLVPKQALIDCIDFYLKDNPYDKNDYDFIAQKSIEFLKIEEFNKNQILEKIISDKAAQ